MLIDVHNHIGVEFLTYLRGEFPYCQDVPTLLAQGRACGVSHWVVFPFVSYAALDTDRLRRGEIALGGIERVPYALENRRLLEEVYRLWPDCSAPMLPFVMVDPSRETEAQAAELKKLRGEYRFYGIKIQSTMIQSPIDNLLRQGRVFLELAEDWDIPFLIHSSYHREDCWAQSHTILDVVEATPGVRFNLAHSCRFERSALERLNALPNAWFDCSAHGIHCQLAVKQSPIVPPENERFDADYADPGAVLTALAEAYPDKLLWGSDSPFYTWKSLHPPESVVSDYAAEVSYLNAVPEPLRARASGENVLNWLGLEASDVEL